MMQYLNDRMDDPEENICGRSGLHHLTLHDRISRDKRQHVLRINIYDKWNVDGDDDDHDHEMAMK